VRIGRLAPAILLAGCFGTSQAVAADARLERVVVLPSRERVSVVFELTAEPAEVSTRRVSAAVFEIDAGPVATPVAPSTLVAPPGVRFVSSVAIQGAPAGSPGVLKARITLLERSRSSVRVVGRRVYVDFMAGDPPRQLPPEEPQRAERVRPAATPQPAAPKAADPPHASYARAAQPVWDRLEELRPFLLSAASAPSPPVLQALEATLNDIGRAAAALETPTDTVEAQRLLIAAIDSARTAVDATFSGDRTAQVALALSLLRQARDSAAAIDD
jgi:hypothetical protein